MDKKCAPGVDYTHGSCINHETLENIADNFNNYFPEDKIESNLNKKELVKKLDNKFNEKFGCQDQICWINQNFVKRMKNKNLSKFTFRPMGPKKQLDWLSTTNINDVIDVLGQWFVPLVLVIHLEMTRRWYLDGCQWNELD